MTDTDENLKIQKITKLLERGGTMLANHHECGAPMFRYQGKVLCPVCEGLDVQKKLIKPETKQEIKQETKAETDLQTRSEIRTESKSGSNKEWKNSNMGSLIKNKIQNISESLDNETDIQRVKDKLGCIELGVKILKLMED